MPNRGHDRDLSSSPSSPSSLPKVAFYDTTPYFRQFFARVTESHAHPVQYKWIESRLSSETVDLAGGCQIACVFVSDKVDAAIAKSLSDLGIRMIAIRSAGFNNVDVKACDQLNVTVARVPAYSPYAVAEMATTLILALNRKVHHAYARVRDYNFSLDRLVGFDMHGKTVGVLGTGKIGQCFIDIMLGFGCHVVCYDVVKAKALEGRSGVKYVDLDSVFRLSDIVSLHLPLTPQTKYLVSAKTLSMMKPTALLINTGRGELVHTADLLDALREGRLGGAALDVYEEEGEYFYSDLSEIVVKDRELLEVINQPNCIVTSHQAFLTEEALTAIAKTTLDNIAEFTQDGKKMGQLKNSVNEKGKKKKPHDKAPPKLSDTAAGHGDGHEQHSGVKGHPTAARLHGQSERVMAMVRGKLEEDGERVKRERGQIRFVSRM